VGRGIPGGAGVRSARLRSGNARTGLCWSQRAWGEPGIEGGQGGTAERTAAPSDARRRRGSRRFGRRGPDLATSTTATGQPPPGSGWSYGPREAEPVQAAPSSPGAPPALCSAGWGSRTARVHGPGLFHGPRRRAIGRVWDSLTCSGGPCMTDPGPDPKTVDLGIRRGHTHRWSRSFSPVSGRESGYLLQFRGNSKGR